MLIYWRVIHTCDDDDDHDDDDDEGTIDVT